MRLVQTFNFGVVGVAAEDAAAAAEAELFCEWATTH